MDKKFLHLQFIPIHLSGPLKIAGIYLVLGVLWILFSDQITAGIVPDQATFTRISTYKGWGYVIVTALLLYMLIRRHTLAMLDNEKQLHLITDALPALISYVDSNKYYRFNNKAYQDWFGGRATGSPIEKVLGTKAYQTISQYVDKALSGELVNYEATIPYKDGGERYVNATYTPDTDANGKVLGFFVLVQDMTERKKTEEELRLWADAFEGCAHGIAISDPNTNRILACNPAYASMHKYRAEDVVGTSTLNLYADSDRERVRHHHARADQIGRVQFEANKLHKDGSMFLAQVDVVTVRGEDGDSLYRVSTALDITESKVSEEALVRSEKRYRALFENMPNGFARCQMLYDENGKPCDFIYLDINNAFKKLTGLENPIGRRVTEVIPGIRESNPEIFEIYGRVAATGKPENFETFVPVLGAGIWFSISVYCPEKGFFVAVFETVTERKQAENALRESEERLRLSLQAANQGLYDLNVQTGGAIVNREYAEMLGYDPDTFIETNASWIERLHPDDHEITAKAYSDYINGLMPEYRIEFRQRTNDGSWKWILSLGKVVEYDADGKPLRMLGTHTDITERKQAEEKIRRLNDDLEQRVIDRTSQLEAANQELEAFSYSVSHDLRAPLRAIDGFTGILVSEYGSMLDEEGNRICGIISKESQRMGQLINDLLAFSRLGRRELHSAKIDMTSLANSIFNELVKDEAGERIDFRIEKLHSALGDPALIRQVWTNLLSNSVKFTSGKKRAVIEVGSTQNKDEIVYHIRDNGAGFDMEYVGKLFGVFQRLHGESEFEGTGVGLAIVKRVIHRHGGRVWAEGKVDEGATFHFVLPRKGNGQ
jgi:PAS domain S-box-containing protein